jgi:hypothetical protein
MRRLSTAGLLVPIAVLLAACSSTTNGAGNGSGAPTTAGTSTSAVPSRLPPPSPSTSTSSASTSVPPPPTTSAPVTSSTPTALPTPPVCASGGCTKNKVVDLGDGYTVTLYTGSSAGGAVGSTVLELDSAGTPVFWQVTKDQIAGDLACSPRPMPNCVVVAGVGAHASVATGYTRQLNRLVKYGNVPSDTPSTDPIDLNGDGLIDVVTAINTYEPSYATGKVFWQTFQSTGTSFESTGCTKPAFNLPPEPSAPLTGTCPS